MFMESPAFSMNIELPGEKLIGALLVGTVFCFLPSLVGAQALRFQPQGAAAAGQGNAFAAQADDASAIHYNPAGLSQVDGIQMLSGTGLLGGSIKANTPAGGAHGDFGGTVVVPPPSHTFLSANLGALEASRFSAVTVGIGVTSPFGLLTRYPSDGPFNSAATESALPLIAIKPTVAYRVTDDLSVGVGADIYTFAGFLGEGQAEQKLVGAGGASIELNGKGTGAGVTASLLYTPLRNSAGKPLTSIGLVYRSQAVLPLSGSLLVNGQKVADATTNLVLPAMFTGALAVWPVRNSEQEWKVELDVEYVGWQAYHNLDVHLSNGTTIPQPQQWTAVPVIAVGTELKWLNPAWLPDWDVALRSGYTRTENPVPDRTFSPATISLSSNTLSVGAGFVCRGAGKFLGLIPCSGDSLLWPKAIGLDLAYQEWFYDPRTVSGNLNSDVNGTYHAFVHLGIFSFKLMF
jgi:long-chain fatty acid transport protein